VVINPGDYHTSNSANRRKFLAPVGSDDPYRKQFEETLSVIEKDEAAGWDPKILAIKIAKIIGSRNPRQRYIIASYEQTLAVKLKYILPGKWFMKILGDHYKIR
jgi:hypothetical protein